MTNFVAESSEGKWFGSPAGQANSVALLLHGLGHDPDRAWSMLRDAFAGDVAVHSLSGPITAPDGDGRTWFGVAFTDSGPRANLAEARTACEHVIAMASRLAMVNPPAIVGFGQGGVVVLGALLSAPELFADVAVAGARLMPELVAAYPSSPRHRGKRVFWGHGRADPAIPFSVAAQGRARLAEYAMDVTSFDHALGHEAEPGMVSAMRTWLRSRD